MPITGKDIAWLVMALPVFLAIVKMFWNAAEFFISAKLNLAALTNTVAKIDKKLDEGMSTLQERVTILERKEEVRHAIEAHDHIAE